MIYLSTPCESAVVNSCSKQKSDNFHFDKIIHESIKQLKIEGYAYVFTEEQAREVEAKTAAEIKVGNGYYKLIAREER